MKIEEVLKFSNFRTHSRSCTVSCICTFWQIREEDYIGVDIDLNSINSIFQLSLQMNHSLMEWYFVSSNIYISKSHEITVTWLKNNEDWNQRNNCGNKTLRHSSRDHRKAELNRECMRSLSAAWYHSTWADTRWCEYHHLSWINFKKSGTDD